jgi:5'-nucleotidase
MEGVFLGIPFVAMSLAAEESMDFNGAAGYCLEVLRQLLPVTAGHVININIPRLSRGAPRGIKVVPQSTGGFQEKYLPVTDAQGQRMYQLNGGDHRDDKTPTDTSMLAAGHITITSLAADMTNRRETSRLAEKDLKI